MVPCTTGLFPLDKHLGLDRPVEGGRTFITSPGEAFSLLYKGHLSKVGWEFCPKAAVEAREAYDAGCRNFVLRADSKASSLTDEAFLERVREFVLPNSNIIYLSSRLAGKKRSSSNEFEFPTLLVGLDLKNSDVITFSGIDDQGAYFSHAAHLRVWKPGATSPNFRRMTQGLLTEGGAQNCRGSLEPGTLVFYEKGPYHHQTLGVWATGWNDPCQYLGSGYSLGKTKGFHIKPVPRVRGMLPVEDY